jgi:hypothetical protein
MSNPTDRRPVWDKMSTQEILEILNMNGYGAKNLSKALNGVIHYKNLHRWKSGDFQPRNPRDRALIQSFAADLLGGHNPAKRAEDCHF